MTTTVTISARQVSGSAGIRHVVTASLPAPRNVVSTSVPAARGPMGPRGEDGSPGAPGEPGGITENTILDGGNF